MEADTEMLGSLTMNTISDEEILAGEGLMPPEGDTNTGGTACSPCKRQSSSYGDNLNCCAWGDGPPVGEQSGFHCCVCISPRFRDQQHCRYPCSLTKAMTPWTVRGMASTGIKAELTRV